MTLKIINGFKGSLQKFLTALTEKKEILFFKLRLGPQNQSFREELPKKA